MTDQELKDWQTLQRQYTRGYHFSQNDWLELIRLNYLVLEVADDIHNCNMLKKEA